MTIGIDISQLTYANTGVANYLKNLVLHMVEADEKNKYILFFSSLRGKLDKDFEEKVTRNKNVTIKKYFLPQTLLAIMWNRIHKLPIEYFTGQIDTFITSDWTEPPTKGAKKASILYDLVVYKTPDETDKKIVSTQKAKHKWMVQETDIVFCISNATKQDAVDILGIDEKKLKVIYPGV